MRFMPMMSECKHLTTTVTCVWTVEGNQSTQRDPTLLRDIFIAQETPDLKA